VLGPESVRAERSGAGVYRFDELPDGAHRVEVRLHERTYALEAARTGEPARLRVPVHGALVVQAPNSLGIRDDPWLCIEVRPLDGSAWSTGDSFVRGKDAFRTEAIELVPGRYEVALRQEIDAAEVDVLAPFAVTIEAGETTIVAPAGR